ncbi:hypothetical protein RUM43_008788 [Polyplax serrata]|uniref:Uncharacterized protein n=1 Tax=Polyplax serrata TaxID=468196 RepID=A0AAN8S0R3_POLSC
MTRREKLLMRPWQLRRYNNHKMKVINALPMVDFGPPLQHGHVTVKLKKLQKERERQMKIEEDNFKLLQHLGAIMTKKRVDNYWETAPPTFLRRVGIYHRTRTPTPCLESASSSTSDNLNKKSKCSACVPEPEKPVQIPEERIPWDPPKKVLTRRQSRSAVCPVISDFDFKKVDAKTEVTREKNPVISAPEMGSRSTGRKPAKGSELPVLAGTKVPAKIGKPEQTIVLRQGQLQVVVNFPSFAEVKVVRGKTEKYLQRNFCGCKSRQPIR